MDRTLKAGHEEDRDLRQQPSIVQWLACTQHQTGMSVSHAQCRSPDCSVPILWIPTQHSMLPTTSQLKLLGKLTAL